MSAVSSLITRWATTLAVLLAASLSMPAACLAQSADADTPRKPAEPDISRKAAEADAQFLFTQGAHPRFESASKVSPEAEAAIRQQRIFSVPHFSGSFASDGRTVPYTIVGARPQSGGTTQIPTQILPISMIFDGYVDENGDPLVLDPEPILARVKGSPNFRAAQYSTGFTQFADAVQRAQFFKAMGDDWHTLLGAPQMLKPLRIEVPAGWAKVYRNHGTGAVYAVVDGAFFVSQLNTVVQLADLKVDALPIALTMNVFLAPEADPKRCCVLGFHTAFDAGQRGDVQLVQTLVWASWTEPGILGPTLADVTPMSHEISEWMNDPFGTNLVPDWQYPLGAGGCQNTLETADPLATHPAAGFPVTIDNFTYHPQNQVLLQWFARQSPSDAFDGALTFPDQTLLTRVSQPCTVR